MPTATISKHPDIDCDNQLAIPDPTQGKENSNMTQNVSQMLKQNPIGMFVGANLSNCTININMPK